MNSQLVNPMDMYPKPPFKSQPQEYPASDAKMDPKPDHGEESYQGSGKLTGRKALITGADSGIGRAIAIAYAREGADVAFTYLDEEEDAKVTQSYIEKEGKNCLSFAGDIKSQQYCKEVIKQIIQAWGSLDILVNNAGKQMSRPSITDIPEGEFEEIFATNMFSTFYFTQAAMPHLPPGSSIINTISIQTFEPSAELLHYASTKGAMYTFTKALAQEAIEKGIRVNAVAPGPVWTPLQPYSMPNKKIESFGSDTLIKRPSQPAELASSYVFLASNEASSIVGQVIGVTGGLRLF